MKKRGIFYLLSALLLTSVLITSCEDDEEGPSIGSSIQGNWKSTGDIFRFASITSNTLELWDSYEDDTIGIYVKANISKLENYKYQAIVSETNAFEVPKDSLFSSIQFMDVLLEITDLADTFYVSMYTVNGQLILKPDFNGDGTYDPTSSGGYSFIFEKR